MSSIKSVSNLKKFPIKRFFSQQPKSTSTTTNTPKSDGGASVNANVTGLTSYVIKQKQGKLGPNEGASITATYKVPEYFSYDRFSYHGAEVELAKYRCPQPSAVKGQN